MRNLEIKLLKEEFINNILTTNYCLYKKCKNDSFKKGFSYI